MKLYYLAANPRTVAESLHSANQPSAETFMAPMGWDPSSTYKPFLPTNKELFILILYIVLLNLTTFPNYTLKKEDRFQMLAGPFQFWRESNFNFTNAHNHLTTVNVVWSISYCFFSLNFHIIFKNLEKVMINNMLIWKNATTEFMV